MKITENASHNFSKQHLMESASIVGALIISYGVKITSLGFYGGDWAAVLNRESVDGTEFGLSFVQNILIDIFGPNPIIYHVVILALLFVCGSIFLEMLKSIGFNSDSALAITLLFLVYPGFYKPVEVLTFIPVLVGLSTALIAYRIFILWEKSETTQYSRLGIGIIFSAISLLTSPFSAGVIGSAFIFLLPAWRKIHNKKKLSAVILSFSLFIFGIVYNFIGQKSVIASISSSFRLTVIDWLNAYVFNWRQIAAVPRSEISIILFLSILFLFGLFLAIIFKGISRYSEQGNSANHNEINIRQIASLIFSIFAGLLVIFMLNLRGNPGESVLEGMGGFVVGIYVSIFIVLCIDFLLLARYRIPLFILLILLSVGTRFSLINRFANETSRIDNMMAQLAVRGDYFSDGSVVVSEQLPFDFTSEASINALFQSKFSQDAGSKNVQYLSANREEMRDFLRGSGPPAEMRIGANTFIVTKENLVGIYYKVGECLQIVDWTSDIKTLPNEMKLVSEISHPELFYAKDLSDVKQLNQFRTKIEEAWCFYYQLANRHASNQEWKEVIATYSGAEKNGVSPYSMQEYLPLLKAQIMEKKYQEAIVLSKEICEINENKQKVCDLWREVSAENILDREVVFEIKIAIKELACP